MRHSPSRVLRIVGLALLMLLASCAHRQAQVVPFDPHHAGHGAIAMALRSACQGEGISLVQVRVALIADPSINAASLGGRRFLFTSGLADTRDARLIRGVVAHEMAHELLGHAKARQDAQALGEAVNLAASFIPGVGGLIASGTVGVAMLVGLPAYSREQEREADARAIKVLASMGFYEGAEEMEYTLTTLQARQGDTGGGWLDSHPATSERIAAMRSLRQ